MTVRAAWARHRFALALLALVVAILFAPALAQREVFTFRDHSDYFQPLRYFTAQHIRAYVLPHWNPYSASGESWLANPQTGVFYPPTWLFAFLPFETAYMLYLALPNTNSLAILINYHPAGKDPAADDATWKKFVESVAMVR